jgi:hypothetical protein
MSAGGRKWRASKSAGGSASAEINNVVRLSLFNILQRRKLNVEGEAKLMPGWRGGQSMAVTSIIYKYSQPVSSAARNVSESEENISQPSRRESSHKCQRLKEIQIIYETSCGIATERKSFNEEKARRNICLKACL